ALARRRHAGVPGPRRRAGEGARPPGGVRRGGAGAAGPPAGARRGGGAALPRRRVRRPRRACGGRTRLRCAHADGVAGGEAAALYDPEGPRRDGAAEDTQRQDGAHDREGRNAFMTMDLATTEQTLLDVWRDVLGVPELTPDSDFFDEGGHSLTAMKIVSRVRPTFD